MSSNAYSAQGSTLKVGATGSAKTITGISKGNPAVITSTAHGLTEGQVVKIASVAGMTEINTKVGIVKNPSANSFQLAGVDSTNFTTYTSGGTATPTQAQVAEFKRWAGPDGQSSDIDVSDLDSTAKEYRAGLVDNGMLGITVNTRDGDDGQEALRASQAANGPVTPFLITFANGKTRAFSGYVKQFTEGGAVDGIIESQVQIKISGAVVRG